MSLPPTPTPHSPLPPSRCHVDLLLPELGREPNRQHRVPPEAQEALLKLRGTQILKLRGTRHATCHVGRRRRGRSSNASSWRLKWGAGVRRRTRQTCGLGPTGGGESQGPTDSRALKRDSSRGIEGEEVRFWRFIPPDSTPPKIIFMKGIW